MEGITDEATSALLNTALEAAKATDISRLLTSTRPTPTTWNQAKFLEFLENSKILTAPVSASFNNIVTNFVRDLIEPSVSIKDNFLAMLYCARDPDELNTYELLLSGSVGRGEILKIPTTPADFKDALEAYETANLNSAKNPAMIKAFLGDFQGQSKENATRAVHEIEEVLVDGASNEVVAYFALYAMILTRLATKDPVTVLHVLETTMKTKYNQFYLNCPFNMVLLPSKTSLESFSSILSKDSGLTRKYLPPLINVLHGSTPRKIGVVKAASLVSLSGTGLGLITWYVRLLEQYGDGIVSFTPDLLTKSSLHSFRKVAVFAQQEAVPSMLWCRLLDDGALIDYSTRHHMEFSFVCCCMTSNDDDVKVLADIDQFEDLNQQLKGAITRASSAIKARLALEGMVPIKRGGVLDQNLVEESAD